MNTTTNDTKESPKSKTYTGASDVDKVTRYLTTHHKTKAPATTGLKFTYNNTLHYSKNDVTILNLKTTHHIYAKDLKHFIRSLKIINRFGVERDFTRHSDRIFEQSRVLNTGVTLKETTEITGIE